MISGGLSFEGRISGVTKDSCSLGDILLSPKDDETCIETSLFLVLDNLTYKSKYLYHHERNETIHPSVLFPYETSLLPIFAFSFDNSTATLVATATFDSTSALFAGILFPSVSSLILLRMKGVFLCPKKPFSFAS